MLSGSAAEEVVEIEEEESLEVRDVESIEESLGLDELDEPVAPERLDKLLTVTVTVAVELSELVEGVSVTVTVGTVVVGRSVLVGPGVVVVVTVVGPGVVVAETLPEVSVDELATSVLVPVLELAVSEVAVAELAVSEVVVAAPEVAELEAEVAVDEAVDVKLEDVRTPSLQAAAGMANRSASMQPAIVASAVNKAKTAPLTAQKRAAPPANDSFDHTNVSEMLKVLEISPIAWEVTNGEESVPLFVETRVPSSLTSCPSTIEKTVASPQPATMSPPSPRNC